MSHSSRHGFTLLELALVLTVIGLLIGGLLVGKEMIRASQLQSVTSDIARYIRAMNDFRDKYQALPGDFAGAEAIWGTDATYGCPGVDTTPPPPPHTATCNGNGDGRIAYNALGGGGMYIDNSSELFRAWQQLADAGMIESSYNGIHATSITAIPGTNVPGSRISGAGYTVIYTFLPNGAFSGGWWQASYNHVIAFGIPDVANASYTYKPALTPAEAMSIDTKIDDGRPASGQVMTFTSPVNPNCNSSDTQSSAQYNTTYSGIACGLIFITGF